MLEAAILSLAVHPDAALQAQVDERVRMRARDPAHARGNNGFEVAIARYQVTGRRELLDQAIGAAASEASSSSRCRAL